MVSRNALKRAVAEALIVLGALGALGTLGFLVRVTVWSSTGAEVTSALNEVPELPVEADKLVSWEADAWQGERRLEPATRIMIEAAYVRAWSAIARYRIMGDTEAVTATLSGPARASVLAMPRDDQGPPWSVGHRLTLTFYALDGGTVALRDTQAQLVRAVRSEESTTLVTTTDEYQVVMVLEDGYWRVRHLRQGGTGPAVAVGVTSGGPPEGATLVLGADPSSGVRQVPAMAGVGYRPAGWPVLDRASVDSDLGRVSELGIDTIRVPLPFQDLGADEPGPSDLRPVVTLLDLAARHRLRVVYTLFDGADPVDPGWWAVADRHLRAVVAAVAGHPALALWDLADRADLRTSGVGPAGVRAWLVHEILTLRGADPERPITVSWSAPETVDPGLTDLVDVVSCHLGTDASAVQDQLGQVARYAGDRPVMVASYGLTTRNGVLPGGHTESEQARYVADVRTASARVGVSRLVYGWFRDPAEGTGPERAGVIRADGSERPAARLLGVGADLASAPRPGRAEAARKPLWWLVAGTPVVVAGGAAAVRRGLVGRVWRLRRRARRGPWRLGGRDRRGRRAWLCRRWRRRPGPD